VTRPQRRARSAGPPGGGVIVVVVVAVAALLALRFMVADDGYPAILNLRAEMSETHRDLRHLQEENNHLRQRIAALRSERYPIEKMAREELDFAAPGEIVYIFPADLAAPGETPAPLGGKKEETP